jgi:ribosomal protein L37AE/L43A
MRVWVRDDRFESCPECGQRTLVRRLTPEAWLCIACHHVLGPRRVPPPVEADAVPATNAADGFA